jgi:signal transduction histidine kinase
MSTVQDDQFGHLRSRARTRVQRIEALPDLNGVEIQALYHQLQVHQAEVELQNEQLQEAQWKLEESLQKYQELFECIPIGYAIVDSRGGVVNCNAAGFELLKVKPTTSFTFNQFLASQDADRFVLLCRKVLSTKLPTRCEMSLKPSDNSHLTVMLECFPITPLRENRLGIAFQDITARVEAEVTLQANQAELQLLTRRLFAAQEEERHKIARDLHDDYGQRVTGMIFETQFLERSLKTGVEDLDRVIRLKKSLKSLLDDFRLMAHCLQPLNLAFGSLAHSMRNYLDEFGKQTNLKVSFRSVNLPEHLSQELGTNLYRVLQESLSNVARHARATRVDVTLSKAGNTLELSITDDGRGFDLKSALQQRKGMGLISMQERVRQLGGKIAIESGCSKGTSIQISIFLENNPSISQPKAASNYI